MRLDSAPTTSTRRDVPRSAIITCFSNDVPTTDTMPRTESARASIVGGGGDFVDGVPVFVVGGGGGGVTFGVFLAVSGAGPTVGIAGGPATTLESRDVAVSTFDDPPAHAVDPRLIAIKRFLITLSSRPTPCAPGHSAEPGTACQLKAVD